ncbi:MAG: DUF2263 domain-containing protein [bacterium]
MSLTGVAQETLQILHAGRYTAPSGRARRAGRRPAVASTRLYDPAACAALLARGPGTGRPPVIEVTDETTQVASARLAAAGPVAALNFALGPQPGVASSAGPGRRRTSAAAPGLYPPCWRLTYYAVNRARARCSTTTTSHLVARRAVLPHALAGAARRRSSWPR